MTDRTTPQPVGSAKDWASVACGTNHTLAVKSGGTLWAWGWNFFGAIGQGDSGNSYSSPVQVGSATDWVAAAGGVWHSIGLKVDGTLWGWGDNGYGALGVGLQNHEIGKTFTPTPTQIDAATDWTTVAAGSLHTLAAKNDGSFLAWGDNGYGQIGVGYPLMRSTPTQIGSDPGWTSVAAGNEQAAATRDDGTLWSWRALSRTPAQVGAARDWAHVFSGRQYFVGLKSDGTLWSWGSANSSGELGVGDTDPHEGPAQIGTDDQWTAVACGSAVLTDGESAEDATSHTVALKADGSLWAWGSNTDGELGRGTADASPHATPKQVGSDTDWTWIAAGAHCTYAIKQTGSLYAWGKNTDGRLGLGDTTSRSTPTLVGTGWTAVAAGADRDRGFALGVSTDHTLWAWGNDDGFQLGFPNGQTTPDHLSPTQVGSDTDWLKIATGGEIGAAHTLAIKTDGTLWAWGANGGGALGNGTYLWQLTPVVADADPHWSTVVCSGESYAIKDDGTLWAWGPNWDSQLGLGDPLWHPQPVDLVFTGDADTTAPTVTASPSPSSAPAGRSPADASPRAAGDARLGAAAPGWYAGKTRVSFTASDGGWGVARTQYSLNGGVGWLTADAFTLSGNGKKTIAYQAVDRAGNASPTVSFTVHIDSLHPATAALTAAKVVRNRSCTLSYKATDKWSPTCAVKVVIKRGAHVVKTILLGQQKSGVSHRTTVRCPWAKGAYRWYVYATDLAGNRQAKVASNSLVVR